MSDEKIFCDACGWQIENNRETIVEFKSRGDKSPLFTMSGNPNRRFLELTLTKTLCEECAKDILYYVHYDGVNDTEE